MRAIGLRDRVRPRLRLAAGGLGMRAVALMIMLALALGNDYDVGGRLLVKHLPKHIPGAPTIIVQNMPQAASIVAANFVYGQAPRDGTVIGSFSRNFPISAMLGGHGIEADPRRFQWLGATSFPGRICAVAHNADQNATRPAHARSDRGRHRRRLLARDPPKTSAEVS